MATALFSALSRQDRDSLMGFARDVVFAEGHRIFEHGESADRFWVLRTGTVHLRSRVDQRHETTLQILGPGELLGWSWLVPPHRWRLAAEAFTRVRAHEFDASAVTAAIEAEPALGLALTRRVLEIVAHRLEATRMRLLDTCLPYGNPAIRSG
jgi:CRP/FNR family transcriptional regulator, cyclic AMP receptor protein